MIAHAILSRTDHRPWPLPDAPWAWRQTWHDLLFAHWPVPFSELKDLVPPGLTIQEFDGTSWVGVVPFRMTGVTLRSVPPLPWLSAFPELNLRLYVEHNGRPGVWFLSLDATNPLAVRTARRYFHLPYVLAKIRAEACPCGFRYVSERVGTASPVRFHGAYRPVSDVQESRPGTLEHFLTERYCLYARSPDGRLHTADIHHGPWPLQPAEAEIAINEIPRPHGIRLEGEPALLHFASRIDVVVWPLRPADPS